MKIQYSDNAPIEIRKDLFLKTIETLCLDTGYKLLELSYVFLSDEDLLEMNNEHLGHDYYTDIITFDLSEKEKELSGDLYISIDRVKENASTLGVTFSNELKRVMIHGALHLVGYNDATEDEKKTIRLKEDHYLNLQPY